MKVAPKLDKDQIAALVEEKELELAKEVKRQEYESSLRRLIKKMEKDGLYIGKTMFSHMKETEAERWEIRNWRSSH